MTNSQDALEEKSSFLAQANIFRHLNTEEMYELNRIMTAITCPPGRLFYRPGEACSTLFLLKSGHVQTYHLSTDGRKLIVATLEAEALFGETSLLQQEAYTSFAEGIDETHVYVINKQDLEQLFAQKSAITYAFLQMMGQLTLQLEAQLIDSTFKSTSSRLADLLLKLAHTENNTHMLVVTGLSHEDLADRLGVYRETVSSTLRELKDTGAIELGRKRIRITRPELLKDLTMER
jgi:CRP-like cAMP-binding protein